MEKIVFNQSELNAAIGCRSIMLCDNDFVIEPCEDTEYIAVGTVSAVVKCSPLRAITLGMCFTGFIPRFDDTSEQEKTEQEKVLHKATSFSSSFKSSFAASFAGSFTSSFKTSYKGSFSGSYAYRGGSFAKSSFISSFAFSSFRMHSSFVRGSAGVLKRLGKKYAVREIAVNGYGLNLI